MKLSEQIILGEFSAKPYFGWWISVQNGKVCGACAVGRLCLASGYEPKIENDRWTEAISELSDFIARLWPWTRTYKVTGLTLANGQQVEFENEHDGFGNHCNDIPAAISDLYEEYGWTMKQIAAWIATIEPAEVRTEQEVSHDPAPVAVPASGGAA